jgi:hypothetical protein
MSAPTLALRHTEQPYEELRCEGAKNTQQFRRRV